MISFIDRQCHSRMLKHLATIGRTLQPVLLPPTKSFAGLRNFSLLSSNILGRNVVPLGSSHLQPTTLLQPPTALMNIERGMKQKGNVKRRCKDCYLVMREDRLYNMCKTHPRHKQMAMKKKDKNTWILTDATQSKLRAF